MILSYSTYLVERIKFNKIEMKLQSVDDFILFNIFGRKNKISKLMISVGIRCKQGDGVLN